MILYLAIQFLPSLYRIVTPTFLFDSPVYNSLILSIWRHVLSLYVTVIATAGPSGRAV